MPNVSDASPAVARLKRWIVQDALPLWGETGIRFRLAAALSSG